MNRELVFARAWSVTHAVKVSALSAVDYCSSTSLHRVRHRTCTCTCWLPTRVLHGYCDCATRACLKILQHLMGLAQATSASGKSCFVCSTQSIHLAMPRLSRDYGKSSSWYAEGWATLANSYSGWSKRASRGYCNHGWNEDATRGSPSAGEAQPETWADAEVEIAGEQSRSQGQTPTTEATDREGSRCHWKHYR